MFGRQPSVAAPAPPTRRELGLIAVTFVAIIVAVNARLGGRSAAMSAAKVDVVLPAGTTFSQAGRTVIVTGSSKGIGKGIASVFAEAGANVLVTSRHQAAADAVAKEIVLAGGVASAFEGDVSVEADVIRMIETAVQRYGGIDVVCANAGVMPDATIASITERQWDDVFDVNVKGTFLTVKHAMPHLKKSAFGRVVLTSSITGPITGFPGWTHYGATKAAQLGFMRSAAVEFAASGITINAVMPGNILTEGLAGYGADQQAEWAELTPVGRTGRPEEVAGAVAYLLSADATFTK